MYSKKEPLPNELNALDVYKLRNDMAVQLLKASGMAIILKHMHMHKQFQTN